MRKEVRRELGGRREYHRSTLASRPANHQKINMRISREERITSQMKVSTKEGAQNILAQWHLGPMLELGGRKGNQGLALHGAVSSRARGPTREESAVRSRGRRGAVEGPLVGIRRREVPAVTEAEVTVEVAETVTSARIREMTTTWKT